jgi:flagellar capping protein FliD
MHWIFILVLAVAVFYLLLQNESLRGRVKEVEDDVKDMNARIAQAEQRSKKQFRELQYLQQRVKR